MEIIFHANANFHKNGCALWLIVRVYGTGKWPTVLDIFICGTHKYSVGILSI